MTEPQNRPGQAGYDSFENQRRIAELEERFGTGGSAATKTVGRVDLYVRDADPIASDANLGTVDLPLKTPQEALDRVPDFVEDQVFIHVGPHAGSGYVFPKVGHKIFSKQIVIIGDGGGAVAGDGFVEVQGSTPAAAGTDESFVFDPSPPADDAWRGFTIEMLPGGTAAGQRRTIIENLNSTGEIQVAREFDPAPSLGDPYRIVRPDVVFNFDKEAVVDGTGRSPQFGFNSDVPYLLFINLRLLGTSGGFKELNFTGVSVAMYGVEVDSFLSTGVSINSSSTQLSAGSDTVFSQANVPVALGLVSDNLAWCGWGLRVRAGNVLDMSPDQGAYVSGYFDLGMTSSRVTINGFFGASGATICGGRISPALEISDDVFMFLGISFSNLILEGTGAGFPAVSVLRGAKVGGVSADIRVGASGTSALKVSGGSTAYLVGANTTASSLSASPIMEATTGGFVGIVFSPPTGWVGMTPASDFSVGTVNAQGPVSVTTAAAAAFAAEGDAIYAEDGSKIQRVPFF
jgi:hypothetical protein